jgi:hypothetical protein
MRSLIVFALFVFMAPALVVSVEDEARVKSSCPEFGRPCECVWHGRDCLPICQIEPRIECSPT